MVQVFQNATLVTSKDKASHIEPVHLFVGVLKTKQGRSLLGISDSDQSLDEQLKKLRDAASKTVANTNNAQPQVPAAATIAILNHASVTGNDYGDRYISVDLCLLAMYENSDLAPLLEKYKSKAEFERQVKERRKSKGVQSSDDKTADETLETYATDLCALTAEGKIDPVIGRNEEIRRVIQILLRRTKNNPVLIGHPGVGKTAIVEGLAHRMVSGELPSSFPKKLYSLDIAQLLAGAKHRGEFEERFKSLLQAVKEQQGQIVLFIDELHTILNAGGGEGSVDAGNMLKPMLARGELRCIGATTLNEYRKVEKDAALERRFQRVIVDEPSEEETTAMLRGLKEKYEIHHGVRINDAAIQSAVKLSQRYITDRRLPDKAIDLIDEAASKARMDIDSRPEELDQVERSLALKKIEIESLKSDEKQVQVTEQIQQQLESLESEVNLLENQREALMIQWQEEKNSSQDLIGLKSELERLNLELDSAERDGDWTEAARLKNWQIPEQRKAVQNAENKEQKQHLRNDVVAEEEIAQVVAKWTGVPVSSMLNDEKKKLLVAEEFLSSQVVGQERAVSLVADAIRTSRAGLKDITRPTGSFLFLGPTGVGKTELSKAITKLLFSQESSLVRLDMSEYIEKHSVARLIGSPPGYIGYEDAGQLTEAVRRKPYCVILVDEIEKAHKDVMNVFLQILDDGILTDGQGRTVDFRQTLIIMTSNLGSTNYFDSRGERVDRRMVESAVMEDVYEHLRPEFINRLDEIVIFDTLSKEHADQILQLQLEKLEENLNEQQVSISLDAKAKAFVLDQGFNQEFGARPMARAIRRLIQAPLAKRLLELDNFSAIKLQASLDEDKLTFQAKKQKNKNLAK